MSGSVRFAGRAVRKVGIPVADLPVFLCPGLLRSSAWLPKRGRQEVQRHPLRASQQRHITSISPSNAEPSTPTILIPLLERLPQQCAGCGALSQTVDKEAAGYYTPTRKSIRQYLGESTPSNTSAEDEIVKAALENAASSETGLKIDDFAAPGKIKNVESPVCDRCHKLKHHETGISIHHPSIQSIQDTIFESPFKYNHVYHVIDAADFPMSLVPGLHKMLNITPQRSLNRRSKTGRFYHGKKTEVSFIITRSDLLAPVKEQVDAMMPYLRTVLRDALGRSGQDIRLGNIRCVSAKSAWWTKELKEDIWKRGGGGWMVGKVNVGKSRLFHDIFPKGGREKEKVKFIAKSTSTQTTARSSEDVDTTWTVGESLPGVSENEELTRVSAREYVELKPEAESNELSDSLDTSSLLPPAPPETDYPAMPLVSSLPGTTASPIRLSFGNGRGELIDLPGLARGDLETYIEPEHRPSLVMSSRVRPEQQTIKPGQSILLGGFIRITPTTPDVIILAYAFTPIHSHLTSTEKAIGIQKRTRETTVENIALPETAERIKPAGTFHLKWDVTRERAGPITRREAAGISTDRLPYKVLAADILIEGCGWVELVAQVRKRAGEMKAAVRERKGERDGVWSFKPEDRGEERRNESRDSWSFKPSESSGRETDVKYSPMDEMDRRSPEREGFNVVQKDEMERRSLGSESAWNYKPIEAPEKYKQERQLERKDREQETEDEVEEIDPSWPTIEVFSPEGKFVAARRPMNAWLHIASKFTKGKLQGRPRKSMKGAKKMEKQRKRAAASF